MRNLALVLTLCALGVAAAAPADPDVTLVRNYLKARLATVQATATPADIDAALALCTDDMVYEHPAFGARVEGRAAHREGMIGHLGETRNARMTVDVLRSANHVVVARVTLRWEVKDGDKWTPGQRENVTAFKLVDGRIGHVWDF